MLLWVHVYVSKSAGSQLHSCTDNVVIPSISGIPKSQRIRQLNFPEAGATKTSVSYPP
ncbi:putative transferase CAF17 [Clarias magur]|uniref:Putative transferase CAF17 n=1 Tax=Clarias magur TaxID=1594786 RepID=A0A8J4XE30_CLAMG|nr:putative transferase CAF17 [Clarias magur]